MHARSRAHVSTHRSHVPPVHIPYIQTRAQMRTCVHMHTRMHTRIRKATRIYRLATLAISHTHASHTHERTHTSFHTHAHTHRKHTHAHDTHAQPRSCIHTHIHTHTHTLTRTHIANIHTHACTHPHAHALVGTHTSRHSYRRESAPLCTSVRWHARTVTGAISPAHVQHTLHAIYPVWRGRHVSPAPC